MYTRLESKVSDGHFMTQSVFLTPFPTYWVSLCYDTECGHSLTGSVCCQRCTWCRLVSKLHHTALQSSNVSTFSSSNRISYLMTNCMPTRTMHFMWWTLRMPWPSRLPTIGKRGLTPTAPCCSFTLSSISRHDLDWIWHVVFAANSEKTVTLQPYHHY